MSRGTDRPTRRRVLHGAAGLFAALAGCSGTSTSTAGGPAGGPDTSVETDPEHYALRSSGTEPVAWLHPEGRNPGAADSPESASEVERHRQVALVASRERADRIAFGDVDGRDEARTFVEGTDFDRETLLLYPESVGECFFLELCYLTWSATEYHVYFSRGYRDVDVDCRTDARDLVAWLIRIPDTLDPEAVTTTGGGTTSSTCDRWEHRVENRDAGDGEGR